MKKNRNRTDKNLNAEKIRRGRISVHPLYFLVGVFECFTGGLPAFVCTTLVALEHECAHAFCAEKLGFELDKITLMPYGAVIDGDLTQISFRDEIRVALAGPLCNLFTAFLFLAVWWLFPESYAYTDVAFYASLSVFSVNLLPAYPLDGGRVLYAFLSARVGEGKAKKITRAVTFFFCGALFFLFVCSLFLHSINLGAGLFSVLLLFGAIGAGGGTYSKTDLFFPDFYERGAEIKRVAVGENCSLKKALSFAERGKYLVLDVYSENGKRLFSVEQNEFASLLKEESIYAKLTDFTLKMRKNP